MSVDLPEPLAPRTPVDLAALDAHRDVVDGDDRLLLPADDEPLGHVLDEEGGHARSS